MDQSKAFYHLGEFLKEIGVAIGAAVGNVCNGADVKTCAQSATGVLAAQQGVRSESALVAEDNTKLADSTISDKLVTEFRRGYDSNSYEFRSPESLAHETGLEKTDVLRVLQNSSVFRRSRSHKETYTLRDGFRY